MHPSLSSTSIQPSISSSSNSTSSASGNTPRVVHHHLDASPSFHSALNNSTIPALSDWNHRTSSDMSSSSSHHHLSVSAVLSTNSASGVNISINSSPMLSAHPDVSGLSFPVDDKTLANLPNVLSPNSLLILSHQHSQTQPQQQTPQSSTPMQGYTPQLSHSLISPTLHPLAAQGLPPPHSSPFLKAETNSSSSSNTNGNQNIQAKRKKRKEKEPAVRTKIEEVSPADVLPKNSIAINGQMHSGMNLSSPLTLPMSSSSASSSLSSSASSILPVIHGTSSIDETPLSSKSSGAVSESESDGDGDNKSPGSHTSNGKSSTANSSSDESSTDSSDSEDEDDDGDPKSLSFQRRRRRRTSHAHLDPAAKEQVKREKHQQTDRTRRAKIKIGMDALRNFLSLDESDGKADQATIVQASLLMLKGLKHKVKKLKQKNRNKKQKIKHLKSESEEGAAAANGASTANLSAAPSSSSSSSSSSSASAALQSASALSLIVKEKGDWKSNFSLSISSLSSPSNPLTSLMANLNSSGVAMWRLALNGAIQETNIVFEMLSGKSNTALKDKMPYAEPLHAFVGLLSSHQSHAHSQAQASSSSSSSSSSHYANLNFLASEVSLVSEFDLQSSYIPLNHFCYAPSKLPIHQFSQNDVQFPNPFQDEHKQLLMHAFDVNHTANSGSSIGNVGGMHNTSNLPILPEGSYLVHHLCCYLASLPNNQVVKIYTRHRTIFGDLLEMISTVCLVRDVKGQPDYMIALSTPDCRRLITAAQERLIQQRHQQQQQEMQNALLNAPIPSLAFLPNHNVFDAHTSNQFLANGNAATTALLSNSLSGSDSTFFSDEQSLQQALLQPHHIRNVKTANALVQNQNVNTFHGTTPATAQQSFSSSAGSASSSSATSAPFMSSPSIAGLHLTGAVGLAGLSASAASAAVSLSLSSTSSATNSAAAASLPSASTSASASSSASANGAMSAATPVATAASSSMLADDDLFSLNSNMPLPMPMPQSLGNLPGFLGLDFNFQ